MGAGASEDGDVAGSAFHTVILHKIPPLSMERLPEVRRLITLIDVLYDHQVKVAPFRVAASARPRACLTPAPIHPFPAPARQPWHRIAPLRRGERPGCSGAARGSPCCSTERARRAARGR